MLALERERERNGEPAGKVTAQVATGSASTRAQMTVQWEEVGQRVRLRQTRVAVRIGTARAIRQ